MYLSDHKSKTRLEPRTSCCTAPSNTSALPSHDPQDNPQGVCHGSVTRVEQRFPGWIEKWNPELFRQVGYGLAAGVLAMGTLGSPMMGVITACPVGLYWWIGLRDMNQEQHSLRRNFPVLANVRCRTRCGYGPAARVFGTPRVTLLTLYLSLRRVHLEMA